MGTNPKELSFSRIFTVDHFQKMKPQKSIIQNFVPFLKTKITSDILKLSLHKFMKEYWYLCIKRNMY
jgi:hypothetical protein